MLLGRMFFLRGGDGNAVFKTFGVKLSRIIWKQNTTNYPIPVMIDERINFQENLYAHTAIKKSENLVSINFFHFLQKIFLRKTPIITLNISRML